MRESNMGETCMKRIKTRKEGKKERGEKLGDEMGEKDKLK